MVLGHLKYRSGNRKTRSKVGQSTKNHSQEDNDSGVVAIAPKCVHLRFKIWKQFQAGEFYDSEVIYVMKGMDRYRVFYAAKYIDDKQYQEDLSFEELQKWIVTDGDDEDNKDDDDDNNDNDDDDDDNDNSNLLILD